MKFSQITLYAGSCSGENPAYVSSASLLGRQIARRNISVTYGGSSQGLMGVFCKSFAQEGGEIHGVITEDLLEEEKPPAILKNLKIVQTMAERKKYLAQNAQAFIVLPGGLGTLEELSEMLSWQNMGIHSKPIGILNVAGYWNSFMQCLEEFQKEKFIPKKLSLFCEESPIALLDKLEGNI